MTTALKHLAPIAFVLLALAIFFTYRADNAHGSQTEGQEYMATTTYADHPVAVRTLKLCAQACSGSLAQVTITGDNTGLITFYDATTTNVDLRAAAQATSSILLADFPSGAPEGTYTFDLRFTRGLIMVTSTTPATSTVMWR